MISKKDIPLNLLKAIEPNAQENLDLIHLRPEDNTYYCFVENDLKSKNYFKIYIDGKKRMNNFDQANLVVEMKPIDETGTRHHLFQSDLKVVASHFLKWVTLIREIHNTPSLHDDNFIKTYSDFYFNEYKIVDDDAYTSPFNPHQQEVIELYLDSLTQTISETDQHIDETIKSELILDIEKIKTALSISTKAKVMRSITNIYGKLFKISKIFAKNIAKAAEKKLIEGLIDLGIKYGPKLLDAIKDHHHNLPT